MLRTYDVAIWPANPDYCLSRVGYIEAETAFVAVLSLMALHRFRWVYQASARPVVQVNNGYVADGPIERFDGVAVLLDPSAQEPDEEDVDVE